MKGKQPESRQPRFQWAWSADGGGVGLGLGSITF